MMGPQIAPSICCAEPLSRCANCALELSARKASAVSMHLPITDALSA